MCWHLTQKRNDNWHRDIWAYNVFPLSLQLSIWKDFQAPVRCETDHYRGSWYICLCLYTGVKNTVYGPAWLSSFGVDFLSLHRTSCHAIYLLFFLHFISPQQLCAFSSTYQNPDNKQFTKAFTKFLSYFSFKRV